MSDAPHRGHELICKIGGDNAERVADELRSLAMRLERGEITQGCIGGSDVGSLYSYVHRPEMTHDKYFADLKAHLEAEKAKQQPPPSDHQS